MSLLNVKNISYSYGQHSPVFSNVSFNIKAGEILTLLGPNGVGKSTLINCLLGLTKPNTGQILLNNRKLSTLNRRQIAQQIAYVPQDYHISTNLSVYDFLMTGRAPFIGPFNTPGKRDQYIIQEYLQRFNLISIQRRAFSSLSGGQQQLITIIKALIQNPQILILDEPMAALDLNRQREVINILQSLSSKNIAIVLTSHLPDHVFMLDSNVGLFFPNGHLKIGQSDSLMTTNNLKTVYKTDLELIYLPKLHRYTCQLIP